jgi:uncharacterized membrane protein
MKRTLRLGKALVALFIAGWAFFGMLFLVAQQVNDGAIGLFIVMLLALRAGFHHCDQLEEDQVETIRKAKGVACSRN